MVEDNSPESLQGIEHEEVILDGRQRRRVDNKRRLFQAFLTLINEGTVSPTAQDLARRAEVGLRSVFRHYPEMEGLYQEMALHVQSAVRGAFASRLDAPDWRERLADEAQRRAWVYDSIMPYQIAIEAHRHESLPLNQHQKTLAQLEQKTLKDVLGDVIGEEQHLTQALHLMLSFDTWLRLRRDQGLSHADAVSVVIGTCQALLGGVAAFNSHLKPQGSTAATSVASVQARLSDPF
jgi:AcrR family transcriptional regulator